MPYAQLITRSFSIMWNRRYLWLLAILGGADVGGGGGGFGGQYSVPSSGGRSGGQPGQFISDNLGLVTAIVAAALLLALAWFFLSCITTGALVRASAEHDAERPFRAGLAWRVGLSTFWRILGLRLLEILLVLLWLVVLLAVAGGFALLGYAAYSSGRGVALAGVIVVGVLAVLTMLVLLIPLGITFILATRSVVLELRGPVAAIGRGLRLLSKRLGRTLLVWLIQVGLSLATAVAIGLLAIILFVFAAVVLVGVGVAAGQGAAIVLGVLIGLVALAVLILLGGISGAYFSTYWTLAFRRLELDAPARAAYWQQPGYPPSPAG